MVRAAWAEVRRVLIPSGGGAAFLRFGGWKGEESNAVEAAQLPVESLHRQGRQNTYGGAPEAGAVDKPSVIGECG